MAIEKIADLKDPIAIGIMKDAQDKFSAYPPMVGDIDMTELTRRKAEFNASFEEAKTVEKASKGE